MGVDGAWGGRVRGGRVEGGRVRDGRCRGGRVGGGRVGRWTFTLPTVRSHPPHVSSTVGPDVTHLFFPVLLRR